MSRRCSQFQGTSFDMCKFGDITVESGQLCNVHIKPIDPQLCPDQNRANCDVSNVLRVNCSTANGSSHLKVYRNDHLQQQSSVERSKDCVLEVPIKYNVKVAVSGDRNVSIDSMQNASVHVTLGTGECTLNNMQTNQIAVKSDGGNIVSTGTLHGDAKLRTSKNGYINLYKPLSQHLDISTDVGDVTIESLYADESTIVTHRGNVDIRNAHRDVNISSLDSGNVNIQSLDGSLNARVKNGNVSVYVCQHNVVNIAVMTGNITLKVPTDSLLTAVDLKGTSVAIDKQLDQSEISCTESNGSQHVTGLLKHGTAGGKPSATLTAQTSNGVVNLICQDWITSLKLGHNFLDSEDD